ncbi:hypothetical protein LB105_004965 [Salmonella enterica]|uniref:Uncharacterized protein n=4 Tax=Salmonella enterica TaxID=28901 RepID=A0A5U8JE69_SALET|nr:hypothetical protein [Salmonella enterica]EBR7996481.1 hypothetical protein [Salmonella enterica subsp. enterica serovar Panama]EBS2695576.1 hypothetical protein [Salmonella enterica subsp. enterica serovar Newport]EBW8395915.1 hypothetical protein [Salmonella enterica subsp. enterica serovar Florida]ECC9939381.1 hypothetical protein [Salmonella enterica subsp. enterica]EDJ8882247.1 hypothetical protein [Salmonella enterica subsp. diarizonae]EDX6462983.1 hypothetical protein [Salmonella en
MDTQKEIYDKVKKHLYALYKVSADDKEMPDICNLLNFRAISLTLLHTAINHYRLNNGVYPAMSGREVITHMLYEETGNIFTDLNQVSLPLALKIMSPRLGCFAHNTDYKFQNSIRATGELFEKHKRENHQYAEGLPVLRELKWDDLPNDLFGLTPES